ncbi:hypothetical protein DFP73DRAFT_171049 [Morchella snyderi]|nr:hypothetical protein DFP73DRAFT_171049 [Morchella snyderi]
MATTATAPTAANGPASAGASSTASASAARPQLKSTISGTSNGGNTNRRSVQSPIDAQRRNPSRVPWQADRKYNGGSTNAVTSSSPTPSQAAAMKARNPTIPPGGESDTHDKHMHDRTLFLLANLIVGSIPPITFSILFISTLRTYRFSWLKIPLSKIFQGPSSALVVTS